jgi:hypothetical protein
MMVMGPGIKNPDLWWRHSVISCRAILSLFDLPPSMLEALSIFDSSYIPFVPFMQHVEALTS